MGTYVFNAFIVPLIAVITEFIGFSEVIIFAICDRDEKVINAYREHMGFETIEDDKNKIVPIEVKSSNHNNHKSINEFEKKYSSCISRRIMFSQKDISNDNMLELKPIYLAPVIIKSFD